MADPPRPDGDFRPLRETAPLLDAYLSAGARWVTPFSVPGHKGRAGRLDTGLGQTVAGDYPLYGGVDTIKLTAGVLAAAEARAARRYGADWCRFSTGGSTHANQTLCLAVGQPGDRVVVSRSLHRSVLLGLVLAGLEPVWLPPRIDPATGMPQGARTADVASALARWPDAKAVFLTEPSYLGTIGDLEGVVDVAHRVGVPVIVDQAWGAHLGYHPAVPGHALERGADALITSIHKLLAGYSQASLVCARTERLDPDRLERAFAATHTTSPAGSVLASVDGCLALMDQRGPELLGRLLDVVTAARSRLHAAVDDLLIPEPGGFDPGRFDPTRLLILVAGHGADGVEVERQLVARGLPLELADRDTLAPIVTVADDETTVAALVDALIEILGHVERRPRRPNTAVSWRVEPQMAMSPREAFFARHRTVSSEAAIGEVSAELVAPYPPGVPVLSPGELVTRELVDGLRAAAAEGVRIAYAADSTLETLQVVDARPR